MTQLPILHPTVAQTAAEELRRRTAQLVTPVFAAVVLLAVPVIRQQPNHSEAELLVFAAVGLGLLLLSLLLLLRRVTAQTTNYLMLVAGGGLLLSRMYFTFQSGYLDDPARSMFMPFYAAVPLYYLAAFWALPHPQSTRLSVASWLVIASAATWLTRSYWGESPPRQLLGALLLYLWPGNGLYLLLLHSLARRQAQMMSAQLSLAEQERSHRALVQESEAQLRGVFNQAAVGVALLDADGHWLSVNQRLCDITGYSADELLKTDYQTITHPDDLDKDLSLARDVMAHKIDHYSMEKRYLRRDGSVVWIMLYVGRIDATPTQPPRFVSVIEDIGARKLAESQIRQLTSELETKVAERTAELTQATLRWKRSNHSLQTITELTALLPAAQDFDEASLILRRYLPKIFHGSNGSVYMHDKTSGKFQQNCIWGDDSEGLLYLTINDCWALRHGHEHRIEDPRDPLRCQHLGEKAALGQPYTCVPLLALGDTIGLLHLSWPANDADAAPEPILLSTVAKQIALALGNIRLREELRAQAVRDPLTGLYNRRFLDEYLQQKTAEHTRGGIGYTLLMIDLDHFKSVNDRFGHEAGDLVLREIGSLLRRMARSADAVFRYGGEEFLMVLRGNELEQATRAAERLRQQIQALRLNQQGQILPALTTSVGVARYPDNGTSISDVLRAGDQALYSAKREGRNRVCIAAGPAPAAAEQVF